VNEVAEKLQVSTSTVYKYTENKVIPSIKVGNRTRVLQEELNKYVQSCKQDKK
jgi:PTS system nitrogen regulatory IIA component